MWVRTVSPPVGFPMTGGPTLVRMFEGLAGQPGCLGDGW